MAVRRNQTWKFERPDVFYSKSWWTYLKFWIGRKSTFGYSRWSTLINGKKKSKWKECDDFLNFLGKLPSGLLWRKPVLISVLIRSLVPFVGLCGNSFPWLAGFFYPLNYFVSPGKTSYQYRNSRVLWSCCIIWWSHRDSGDDKEKSVFLYWFWIYLWIDFDQVLLVGLFWKNNLFCCFAA